jgi:hypothetical protein
MQRVSLFGAIVVCACTMSVSLFAGDNEPPPFTSTTGWKWSLAYMAGASAFDGWSSTRPGLVEGNPLLGAGRPFSGRAVAFKAGLVGGTALGEWSVVRRHPKAAKIFSYVNFGIGGSYVAVGIYNLRIAGKR